MAGNKIKNKDWSYISDPSLLVNIRKDLRQALSEVINESLASNIVIAVNEACMNIMQHANNGAYKGLIDLHLHITDNEVVINIKDEADPVDPETLKGRALDVIEPGGLGLHLMNDIMDSVKFVGNSDRKGNKLIMTKAIADK